MNDKTAHNPTAPSFYKIWADDHVRFTDLDPLGHANNCAFSVYFDTGRIGLLNAMPPTDNVVPVLARLIIDFRGELYLDNKLLIGHRVLRLGRTSYTLAAAIFHEQRCIATSEGVCVLIDKTSRTSVPLPSDYRQALEKLM